jgi:DNA-binding transcriptional ArsR family regulator
MPSPSPGARPSALPPAGPLIKVSGTRVRIVELLRERPLGVCALARALGINKSAVHKHLQRLVEAGVLVRLAVGRWVYYRLAAGSSGS